VRLLRFLDPAVADGTGPAFSVILFPSLIRAFIGAATRFRDSRRIPLRRSSICGARCVPPPTEVNLSRNDRVTISRAFRGGNLRYRPYFAEASGL